MSEVKDGAIVALEEQRMSDMSLLDDLVHIGCTLADFTDSMPEKLELGEL